VSAYGTSLAYQVLAETLRQVEATPDSPAAALNLMGSQLADELADHLATSSRGHAIDVWAQAGEALLMASGAVQPMATCASAQNVTSILTVAGFRLMERAGGPR